MEVNTPVIKVLSLYVRVQDDLVFLKAICRENRHSDMHLHCAVHSTDTVIWSLNIQPRSPSCLISQQPSNASAVFCLDSALHVSAHHLGRFFLLLLHEVQSGTVGMSVIFCAWPGYNRQTDQFIESSDKEWTVRQIISGRM